jgi:hypothetical protein
MIRPSSPVRFFTDGMVGLKNISFRPGSCPHGPEGGNKKYQPLELALRPGSCPHGPHRGNKKT